MTTSIREPNSKRVLVLDGNSLTPEDLMRVFVEADDGDTEAPKLPVELGTSAHVVVSDTAWSRLRDSRAVVDKALKKGEQAYGITTGFGALRNVILPQDSLIKLQENLIRSHAAGIGDPLTPTRVKRLLTVRINVLSKGYSGIREVTVRRMVAALNANCLPYIPERGSVGCSGDLAPSAHLALGLMGEGKMWNPTSKRFEAADKVLAEHGLTPVTLEAKEGLAMINGTQLISTLLAEGLVRSRLISQQADLVAACTFEGLRAVSEAFAPEVHEIRGHQGQIDSATRIRAMLHTTGDPSAVSQNSPKNVQDAYSVRCTPQVHGITHETVDFAWGVCARELNAATDNPLVFPDGKLISGGNFHGEYPGKVADYLAIGVSELGCISERRIERMLNPALSGPSVKIADDETGIPKAHKLFKTKSGEINYDVVSTVHTFSLPPFLISGGESGLNSGFMIPHCTAAALVSENKVYCHPSTVDSISTSAAQEDHVSMAPFAALKLLRVVENVERILGIELFAACQALDLTGMRSTRKIEAVKRTVRSKVEFWKEDRYAAPDMDACFSLLRQGHVLRSVVQSGAAGAQVLDIGIKPSLTSAPQALAKQGSLHRPKFLVLHDARVVTMAGASPGRFGSRTACKRGPKEMNDLGILEHHSIVVNEKGLIFKIGHADSIRKWAADLDVDVRHVECGGNVVMPGFVDAHTHAVHSGDRSQELAAKLAGESYQSVTARGGGIHFTVEATQRASEAELEAALLKRLEAFVLEGTTCVEIKSGYGMDVETELKILRVVHAASKKVPMHIVSSFLGAHAVPRDKDMKGQAAMVAGEMLAALEMAQAAGETNVTLIDAFLEEGFYDYESTRNIIEAGHQSSLKLLANFHGDELSDQNSGVLAAQCPSGLAVSHLEYVNDKSIEAMAEKKVVGVVLPTTAFLLKLPTPPVRKMIDRGVPIALASDYNPNAPTMSMPTVMNMACVMAQMTMQEAIVASTINAAASIATADETGSIEVGKRADLLVLSTPSWEQVVYCGLGGMNASPIGANLGGAVSIGGGRLIKEVFAGGVSVVCDGQLAPRLAEAAEAARQPPAKRSNRDLAGGSALAFLIEGLPTCLSDLPPPPGALDSSVPHAPRRPVSPTEDEAKLAIRNALRYFSSELHEVLAPEFARELRDYGHIYMYRFKPSTPLRAWPAEELPAQTQVARVIMHMILNNLDPAVAQFPHELVTYGGNGSVFQNWGQFRLVMKLLSKMSEEQTLVMYSGHPLGLFPSSPQAPRVVVTNGMVIPNYSGLSDYERYYMLGVSQYGQMTAGSYCYIGPQGIVHGTTITLCEAGRKYLGKEDLRGTVYVTAGLGGMSGAQPKAGVICGAICVVAEVSEAALKKRHSQGWLTEYSADLEEVMRMVRKYRASRGVPHGTGGISIGYLGNAVDLWERLAIEEELLVELGSDQTSCHNPFGGGFYPAGMSYEEGNQLMSADPEKFKEAVNASLRRQVSAINKLTARGMRFWDYGNSFMLQAGRAGADIFAAPGSSDFRYPSYVQDIMGDIFSLGFGPFRWVCSSGDPSDLALTDGIAAEMNRRCIQRCDAVLQSEAKGAEGNASVERARRARGCYADNLRWVTEAGGHKLVVGSQARILYSDARGRAELALAFNEAVGSGLLKGPVAISRDHHDVSGVDSPWRETSNITDGSKFCADMAVHNFVGDAFRGATWVALHNGGGTGWGEAINGGFGLVLDGSTGASERASSMLHWDVFNGVSRRAWDGNSNANVTIDEEMGHNGGLVVTRCVEAEPGIVASAAAGFMPKAKL